ncbi:hypothetical protein [Streptomyces sp. NBC_01565]|uniref:hypothetical protein n=1 Tax=Streptomyces sp. NBC_01565 TaxID=2975881 RepID=UPI002252D7AD|nr:hypothetical protein [Streptomyces sp. NBC_01565]MCX4540455.1 hypothetical protein [Streptomyces sp. NBC_01565]
MTAFDRAAAERRLGPAAVAAVRALVDAAPPLSGETRMQIQAVFASAPKQAAAAQPLAA